MVRYTVILDMNKNVAGFIPLRMKQVEVRRMLGQEKLGSGCAYGAKAKLKTKLTAKLDGLGRCLRNAKHKYNSLIVARTF